MDLRGCSLAGALARGGEREKVSSSYPTAKKHRCNSVGSTLFALCVEIRTTLRERGRGKLVREIASFRERERERARETAALNTPHSSQPST